MRPRWWWLMLPISFVLVFVVVVTGAGVVGLGEDTCSTRTSWADREDNGVLTESRTLFWPSVTCTWTDHEGLTHNERISFGF